MGTTISKVFFFGLFFSCFVFWPNSEIPHEIPKIWFISRWIEILAVATFFGIQKIKKERLDKWLVLYVFLFLLIAIVSSVVGVNLPKSIVGNYYRADGLLTLLYFLILYFIVILFSEKSWLNSFFRTLSLSAIILSCVSIFQLILDVSGIISIQTWDGGYGNVFGNPNFLVGYLIVILPLTAYLVDNSASRAQKLWLLGVLVQAFGIFLTNAWVGYFALLIFVVGWLLAKYKKSRPGLLFFGLIIFFILSIHFSRYLSTLETPTSINPESRQRIFMKAILGLKDRPFLGYGWANFDKAFEAYDYPVHMDNDVYVDKAHSSILETLVTTGLIGLAAYLIIVGKVITNLLSKKSSQYRYVLVMFILLILHMQTNVISISEEVLFWIIAGFSTKSS